MVTRSQDHRDSVQLSWVTSAELWSNIVMRHTGKPVVHRDMVGSLVDHAVIGYRLIFREQQYLHRVIVDNGDSKPLVDDVQKRD